MRFPAVWPKAPTVGAGGNLQRYLKRRTMFFQQALQMKRDIFIIFVIVLASLLAMTAEAVAEGDLRFAITSSVASDPSYNNYRELTEYVAHKAGKKSFFVSELTYKQVDNLFAERQVDVGFLCNTHFARRKDAVKFEAIAAPVIMGYSKPRFRIYLIVSKDSRFKSLNDLRGASVDLADPLSTTTIFAAYKLLEKNETLTSFFGKTIYSGSHDMTIRLVADKVVDAGLVDGHIWDYHDKVQPAYSSKTKIIYRSPEYMTPPVVVSRTIDQSLRNKLRNILLTMHEDARGREILKKLRIEKFVAVKDKDYDDVLDIYNKIKGRL